MQIHHVGERRTLDEAGLVVEAGALAVAVDEVGADGADAEDGEADEERDACMHAHVDTLTHVDALLTVRHPD